MTSECSEYDDNVWDQMCLKKKTYNLSFSIQIISELEHNIFFK